MLDNHLYNLFHQLVQENKSLWRIKHHYKDDAGDCPTCKEFWDKMEKDKQDHVKELMGIIKQHMERYEE